MFKKLCCFLLLLNFSNSASALARTGRSIEPTTANTGVNHPVINAEQEMPNVKPTTNIGDRHPLPSSVESPVNNSARHPITKENVVSGEDETEGVGSGSGDDVDTIDESDPAYDADPEAEDGATTQE